MIIVGVSGKRGAGKDLLGECLAPYGFIKMSFAEELKRQVRDQFNLTLAHTDGALKEKPTQYVNDWSPECTMIDHWTPRQIMISYGQFFRQFDPMWWIKKTFKNIKSHVEWKQGNKFVITDVRFANEANYIKEQGGFLVRLERDPMLNIYKGQMNDISETELDNYEHFDMRLTAEHNIVKKDLENFATEITNRIGLYQHEN